MRNLHICFLAVVLSLDCAVGMYAFHTCDAPECSLDIGLEQFIPFYGPKNSTNLVPDSDYLNQHCGELKSYLECMEYRNRSCNLLSGRWFPIRNFHNTVLVMRDLCNEDSPTRASYEHLAACVNDNNQEITAIMRNAFEIEPGLSHLFRQEIQSRNETVGYVDLWNCLAATYIHQETMESLSRICSADDANFAEELYFKFAYLMEDLCPPGNETYQHYLRKFEVIMSEPQALKHLGFNEIDN